MLSFRTRIFCSVLAVSLLAIGIAVIYGKTWLEDRQLEQARQRILHESRLAGLLLERLGPEPQRLLELARLLDLPESRLSLMDAAGNVLNDTAQAAQPVSRLDNHADRPEVMVGMKYGQGLAIRPSDTVDMDMAYAVTRLADGRLLRLALPLDNVRRQIQSQVGVFSQIGLITAGLSLLLAIVLSWALRRSLQQMITVVEAISLGHWQRRLRRIPGSEFAPLAQAVNRMAENIEEHLRVTAEQTAQLESILDTMSDGVLVLGARGNIRRCNQALLGQFPEAATAQGAQVVEIIPSPALQKAVEDVLTGSADTVNDGSSAPSLPEGGRLERHLHLELSSGKAMSVRLSRPAGPSRFGLVAVFHDITELMRLERVRRDFVANVSHELRTPLTAIQGYAETLVSLDSSPECRRFGEIILKNGMYLTCMVDDLLALARLEGKAGSLELSPVEAAEALAQASGVCREALERRNIQLKAELAGPLRVMGNMPHLVQVFRNLLENACRYAPEGGSIRVSAQAANGEAVFRVVDDGPGIPPQDMDRIFERFYQVERHRGQATSGLGLAICKHIVERHGGRIRVESPARDGSTALIFTLALAEGASDS